jgi:hypothetical protein
MLCWRRIIAALAFVLALCEQAYAQTPPPGQATAPPQSQVMMPDAEKIVLLLRTSILTLNDALQTGNFTVLRDMGAPGFRDANTAARLSQSFSDLASKNIDLSPVSHRAAIDGGAGARPAEGNVAPQRLFPRPTGADQFRDAVSGGRRALARIRSVGTAWGANAGGCERAGKQRREEEVADRS